ncbi:MAG: hypothetical protein AB2A00_41370 [Myxococcota bacterium]
MTAVARAQAGQDAQLSEQMTAAWHASPALARIRFDANKFRTVVERHADVLQHASAGDLKERLFDACAGDLLDGGFKGRLESSLIEAIDSSGGSSPAGQALALALVSMLATPQRGPGQPERSYDLAAQIVFNTQLGEESERALRRIADVAKVAGPSSLQVPSAVVDELVQGLDVFGRVAMVAASDVMSRAGDAEFMETLRKGEGFPLLYMDEVFALSSVVASTVGGEEKGKRRGEQGQAAAVKAIEALDRVVDDAWIQELVGRAQRLAGEADASDQARMFYLHAALSLATRPIVTMAMLLSGVRDSLSRSEEEERWWDQLPEAAEDIQAPLRAHAAWLREKGYATAAERVERILAAGASG